MTRYNDKKGIRAFYDVISPYFRTFWGEHLHHGYWIRGDETTETAQIQLVEHLARMANVRPGSKILDIGCGLGASSIYLARNYKADATGITISPIQVEMANESAARQNVNARFLLMDAEAMNFNELFDVVWSVESISHYQNKERFFASAAQLPNFDGTIAIIDWFKKENLARSDYEKFIRPIEKGMLNELETMKDYEDLIEANGLKITHTEVMNENCAKSWDIGLEIVKNRTLWRVAVENGRMFVRFLRAFGAMRAGFGSGKFVYGLVVARKSSNANEAVSGSEADEGTGVAPGSTPVLQ
jgi:tocopherol O-methyltransferase